MRRADSATDATALAEPLAALEGAPDAAAQARIERAATDLSRAGSGDRRPFALPACLGADAAVGCAMQSPFFPAPDGQWGLYLEELFGAPAGRRRGVATALLRAAARLALQDGYARLFWTTTPDNAAALALYQWVVGPPSGKLQFQADAAGLGRLATDPASGPAA